MPHILVTNAIVITKGENWLQTANADLARSLATVQWNLEVEV